MKHKTHIINQPYANHISSVSTNKTCKILTKKSIISIKERLLKNKIKNLEINKKRKLVKSYNYYKMNK